MPGDGLALAVLISGQQEFVGVLEKRLELGDLLLLVGVDDVEGLEVVVHVDPEAGPRLAAVLGRDLGSLVGHVADVADAGLDHVALAEVAGNRARLGRRLDDDKPAPGTIGGIAGARASRRPGCRSCCHVLTLTSAGRPGGYRRPATGIGRTSRSAGAISGPVTSPGAAQKANGGPATPRPQLSTHCGGLAVPGRWRPFSQRMLNNGSACAQ